MSWTCDVLHQKRWWLAHIQQENVHVAVISYISKSGTPPARQRKRGEPCCGGFFFKFSVPLFSGQKKTPPVFPAVFFKLIHPPVKNGPPPQKNPPTPPLQNQQ